MSKKQKKPKGVRVKPLPVRTGGRRNALRGKGAGEGVRLKGNGRR